MIASWFDRKSGTYKLFYAQTISRQFHCHVVPVGNHRMTIKNIYSQCARFFAPLPRFITSAALYAESKNKPATPSLGLIRSRRADFYLLYYGACIFSIVYAGAADSRFSPKPAVIRLNVQRLADSSHPVSHSTLEERVYARDTANRNNIISVHHLSFCAPSPSLALSLSLSVSRSLSYASLPYSLGLFFLTCRA